MSFIALLRSLRTLRHEPIARLLGILNEEYAQVETIRATYGALELRIHRECLFQFWSPSRLRVGRNVQIEKGSAFCWTERCSGCISIGNNTWIGQYNNFRIADDAQIVLGDNCLISQFCSIVANNHGTVSGSLIRAQQNDAVKVGVVIGDDVWLGVGATVLPGVRIGSGAVVAAGAVVCNDVGSDEIWAGIPARRIGRRSIQTEFLDP